MKDLSDYNDETIFAEYDIRVSLIAHEITEELNDRNRHSPVDGKDWCEENDVPERIFADAMKHFTEGVDWGISPMYPMRTEEEAGWIDPTAEVEQKEEVEEETDDDGE